MAHLVVVPVSRIEKRKWTSTGSRPGKLQELINQFLDSEAEAVEVVTSRGEYKSNKDKYYSLVVACKTHNIKVVWRGEKIYMVKQNAIQV